MTATTTHLLSRPVPAPRVTVITPAYNRADLLPETIRSVIDQATTFDTEYLVLDDGSTDHTAQVLAAFAGRITHLSHENRGEQPTVNRGLALARGQYVMIVNSDDPLRPGAIAALVNALDENPDAVAAYPDWTEIDPVGTPLRDVRCSEHDLHAMLLEHDCVVGPGAMIRCAALEATGLRDESFRYVADFDLWLRLSRVGRFVHVARPLATWRTHPGAATHAALGKRMAAEHVAVIRKFFSAPDLPPDLAKLRRRAAAWARFAAAYHCGTAHLERFRHLLIGVLIGPDCALHWFRSRARRGRPVLRTLLRRLRGDTGPI